MRRFGCVILACFWLSLGAVGAVGAQETPGRETVDLYFDCQGRGCNDLDFFRRAIPYVNWVRDRQDSDVHVLVTTRTTGGGGREYVLAFLGRGPFEGQDQDVVLHTPADATSDEVRKAIVTRLRLGLGRYLAQTTMADRLGGPGPAGPGPRPAEGGMGSPEGAVPERDPWDFWVFRIGANGWLNGESSVKYANLNGTFSANRTTEAWKIAVRGRLSRNTNRFTLPDTLIETTRESWSMSGLVVRSLTPHLSAGIRTGMGRSTFLNQKFRWEISPGVELNAFPYSESSRRSLTLQALVNVRHWDYESETIFLQMAETRVAASLTSRLELIQPWGRATITLDHSRYLHDTSKYQASLGGFMEVRLFKGFSVNVGGNYGWVRDQLYLPRQGASNAEILLRQKQIATNFRYFTSFGISYRFGSIFNNVVNPRFGGSDDGGVMMIIG